MTLRHMRIFVAVFQNGSVTKASKELHLAQPSVSLAIRELEDYYGVCLFERIGRTISPTDCGREFYRYAVHIDGMFDEMEKRIRDWDALGTLRIGSSIAIGTHILPTLLVRLKNLYPELVVKTVVNSSRTVEQELADNLVDIGLIENVPELEGIVAEQFMDDELCAIAPVGHPLTREGQVQLAQLVQYPILMREKGSAGRDIMDAYFAMSQLRFSPAWESTSSQAIVRGVEKGLGVAILPYLLVRDSLERGEIARIPLHTPIWHGLNIVYHKSKYLTSNMKAFMAIAREYGEEQGERKEPPGRSQETILAE